MQAIRWLCFCGLGGQPNGNVRISRSRGLLATPKTPPEWTIFRALKGIKRLQRGAQPSRAVVLDSSRKDLDLRRLVCLLRPQIPLEVFSKGSQTAVCVHLSEGAHTFEGKKGLVVTDFVEFFMYDIMSHPDDDLLGVLVNGPDSKGTNTGGIFTSDRRVQCNEGGVRARG